MSAAERIGAPEIRLSELSIFNSPPRPSVMAVLKGYVDDSRPGDRIWVLAGYLGNDIKWEEFEYQWPRMLAKHGVPYFHMKELGRPNGVYAKWHPLKDHQQEIEAFYRDMTQVISDCWLGGFFSIVRLDDLARFNASTGLNLEAYALAAYGCLLMVASEYGNLTSEIFFDRADKIFSKLERATSYAESDLYFGEALGNVALMPLPKNLGAKNVMALQAADFFAWELQRNHLSADEWHALDDRPLDEDERWEHFKSWARHKFGGDRPPARRSIEALMEKAAPVSGIVWSYDQICRANELRKGVWSLSDSHSVGRP